MTLATDLKTFLAADSALAVILTGGIHTFEESGRNGISKASVPSAYDSSGIMKPSAFVFVRSDNAWGGGHDSAVSYDSMRAVAEIIVYDSGDRNYASVEAGCLQIETLLHNTFISGVGRIKRINKLLDMKDPNLNNAIYQEIDFQMVRGRQLA